MKGCSSFNLMVSIPVPLKDCLVDDHNATIFKNACEKYQLEKLNAGKTYLIYKKSGLTEEYFFLSVRKLNCYFLGLGHSSTFNLGVNVEIESQNLSHFSDVEKFNFTLHGKLFKDKSSNLIRIIDIVDIELVCGSGFYYEDCLDVMRKKTELGFQNNGPWYREVPDIVIPSNSKIDFDSRKIDIQALHSIFKEMIDGIKLKPTNLKNPIDYKLGL